MFGVYCLMNKDGEIMYIGKGKMNDKGECNRWIDHARGARSKKKKYHIHRWMAKYDGWAFSWLETGLEESAAFQREKELIEKHRAIRGRALLNSAEGGIGMTSEEAKRIASDPVVIEKKRQAVLKNWQDPEYRGNLVQKFTVQNQRKDRREQAREKALKEWTAEPRKEAARKRAKELWADPEWSAARRAELVARNKAGTK